METKNKEKQTGKKQEGMKQEQIVMAADDSDCPVHGNLKARGRVFEGKIIRKFPKRVAIEFERMVYVRKYERYTKSRTKIHARLPSCMEKDINLGDLIRIQECRPLSKIIHFVVIGKVKGKEEIKK